MRRNVVSPPMRLLRSSAMLALIQVIQELSHTPFEYQNCIGDANVMAGTIAFSDGGFSTAASHWTAPGYERPNVPIHPVDHGCFAAHSIVSYPSLPSC